MPITNSFDSVDPGLENPDLRKIAEELLVEFKTAAVRVAMGYSQPDDENSWEQLGHERLRAISKSGREKLIGRLRTLADDPDAKVGELGKYAHVDLRSPDLLVDPSPSPIVLSTIQNISNLLEMGSKPILHPFIPVVKLWGEVLPPVSSLPDRVALQAYNGQYVLPIRWCMNSTSQWAATDGQNTLIILTMSEIDWGGFSD